MKNALLLSCLLIISVGCRDIKNKTAQEMTATDAAAGLNEKTIIDTTTYTQLQWIDSVDQPLGKLKAGKEVEIKWRFKNSGQRPLVIENVSASCGCTIPEKPEKPLLPGEEGFIKAKFNGSGSGEIFKQVHVTANTTPTKEHTLSFSGTIPSSN
jgi:hypothetical protein